MRQRDDVRQAQQRRIFSQRLVLEDIKAGSVNVTRLQGGDQRLLIDHRAAPGVNKDGGRFHFGELRLTEQMVGLFAQGQDQADKIGFLQQGIEIAIAGVEALFCLRMLAARVVQDRHAEPEVGALRQRHADAAHADDT